MKTTLLCAVLILVGCGQGQRQLEDVLIKETVVGFYSPWTHAVPLKPPCLTWREATGPVACSAFVQNQPVDNSFWAIKYWAQPSGRLGDEPRVVLTIAEVARFIELRQGEQYVWWYEELVEAKQTEVTQ